MLYCMRALSMILVLLTTACVHLDRVTPESAELTPQTRESVEHVTPESAELAPQTREPVEGEAFTIAGTGADQTLTCNNQDIRIEGIENVITLTGRCGTLQVEGNRNQVQIEQVAAIEVHGVENTVMWQEGTDDNTPTISNTGSDNRIQQESEQVASDVVEEAAEESSVNDLLGGDTGSVSIDLGNLDSLIGQVGNPEDMIVVAGTGDARTSTCENNSAIVTGAENTLTLEGTCEAIIVAGAENDIFVEGVVSITLAGAENTITWQNRVDGQPPTVTDAGVNNVVEQGERP